LTGSSTARTGSRVKLEEITRNSAVNTPKGGRPAMAATPATHYRAYKSKPVALPNATTSSKQLAKRLQSDATTAGFALIGRKARVFAK